MASNLIPANDHSIPLDQAVELTKRYRDNKENILADEYKGQNILPLSETFSKDAFNSFFNNPDCVAIRIYYGMTEDLQTHAVIVGANEKNEDILPAASEQSSLTDPPPILEDSYRCPPTCPPTSSLNYP